MEGKTAGHVCGERGKPGDLDFGTLGAVLAFSKVGAKMDLSKLLKSSNIPTLHARLTFKTKGLIGPKGPIARGRLWSTRGRGGLLDYGCAF